MFKHSFVNKFSWVFAQYQDHHVVLDDLAWPCNFNSCLQFVTCEHEEAYLSHHKLRDGDRDTLLQFVFDGWTANKPEFLLHFVKQIEQLLFFFWSDLLLDRHIISHKSVEFILTYVSLCNKKSSKTFTRVLIQVFINYLAQALDSIFFKDDSIKHYRVSTLAQNFILPSLIIFDDHRHSFTDWVERKFNNLFEY